MRFYSSIDDNPITIQQPCIFHTVTFNITVERCFWMPDIITVEV